MKRREGKSKGEKERYTHLNVKFQRIARRNKKAFFSHQCKEYVPDEGTKIKRRRTTKWREDRQPTWKRIQSNDGKDDGRSQKKNEGTDWEDKINV